jgi:UMF1 family MFS transporter
MFLVALTAPFLGGVADHAGVRKRMLVLYTLVGVGATAAFATLQPGWILLGFVLGAMADFSFEGGAAFYNSYLPDIAPASHQGRVSAWGFATGYVGSLLALGAAFVLTKFASLSWVWIALGAQWLIASIPSFRNLPKDRGGEMSLRAAARAGFARTVRLAKEAARTPRLGWFLLAFFFYMDGVNTVITFASVYAKGTLGFTTGQVFGIFAMVQLTALIGSMIMAGPTDRKGPHWAVKTMLWWWIAVVIAAYLATDKAMFLVVAVLAGLGLGAIQAASRTYMSRLVVPGREAEMFGLYALCGKTGSILGPLMFGHISEALGDQRPAVLSVALLYILGLVFLHRTHLESGRSVPGTISP